jgi:hypothetical protein
MQRDITIDKYTGSWDHAMDPGAPAAGMLVRIRHDRQPDGRELDAFLDVLQTAGLVGEYVEMEDDDGSQFAIYRIRERLDADETTLHG